MPDCDHILYDYFPPPSYLTIFEIKINNLICLINWLKDFQKIWSLKNSWTPFTQSWNYLHPHGDRIPGEFQSKSRSGLSSQNSLCRFIFHASCVRLNYSSMPVEYGSMNGLQFSTLAKLFVRSKNSRVTAGNPLTNASIDRWSLNDTVKIKRARTDVRLIRGYDCKLNAIIVYICWRIFDSFHRDTMVDGDNYRHATAIRATPLSFNENTRE